MSLRYSRGARLAGALLLAGLATPAHPGSSGPEVTLVGTFPNKAVLVVGQSGPRTVASGQSLDGVTVISVASDSVVIEASGRRRTLRIGQVYAAPSGGGNERAILSADRNGHFFADAQVNGALVRMLVDTGASLIAIPAREADRLGLNYMNGSRVSVATANGITGAYRVKIDTITLGGITMTNVDAIVQTGGLFMPLLGMSFLSRTNIQREGETMTLTKRF